jgi:hypothetical protein
MCDENNYKKTLRTCAEYSTERSVGEVVLQSGVGWGSAGRCSLKRGEEMFKVQKSYRTGSKLKVQSSKLMAS